ncbi:MAG: tyrosine-type recombinase/integrase [Chitinophagaceae bacterium]|nr:tyrosine-type recombinase/integrase [Chitinophagaceae bacterium]MCB9047378.1 tyrosine-type recombinase/integrase [Chitinophagales bacterium]
MIAEWLTDFLKYLKFEKRYSHHTLIAYEKDLLQFLSFIDEQFQLTEAGQLTHFHVRSWLATMKDDRQSARTINRKLSSLNSFYKYLQRLGKVKKNPVRQLHAQKLPERLPSYLKEQETSYLLEEKDFEPGFKGFTDRMICNLLYQTGIRRSELLQMKEQDIEWSLKQVRVLGKGNKERLVPLGPQLQQDMRDYIAEKRKLDSYDDKYLLVLENGKQLYAGYVYRVVKNQLGGITSLAKKSPHVLRHTFATHLLNNGANIQAIKDLLGHSSLAATQVYTHNNIEQLKEIHKTSHPRG